MKTPKQVILEWVDALNAHDANRASELYHDDAENIQIAIGQPLVGKTAIREDFQKFFQSTPNTFTKIENLFEDGNWAILEWSGGGTFYNEEESRQLEGRPYVLRGCGFFQIVDGKIKFQRGYWDKATWFRQVGLAID